MKTNEISLILPAYREAENLKKILPVLNDVFKSADYDYEILVIDTETPTGDGTAEVCAQCGGTYINRRGGNNYGDAIRTGIASASKSRIAVMDADGSHNPRDLVRMMETMDTTDASLVIGSRYTAGGSTDNNFILRLMSYMVNVAYRVLFHIRVKDVSDSFRLYDAAKLKSLRLQCDNFDLVEEILVVLLVKYPQMIIKEIPIRFSKRDQGESKRDLMKFVLSYVKTICKLLKVKHEAMEKK